MEHKNGDFINYKKIFKNQEKRIKLISMLRFIPDKPYVKMVYRLKTGRKLNLKNPVIFREKMNWLKIYDRHPEYTNLVDKIKVKEIVAKKIGEEYVIPTLGVWEHFDDIDFDSLPDKFVLKCNHDSRSTRIIDKKKGFDKDALRKFFEGRLKLSQFYLSREYPYKDVERRIFAEQFVETPEGDELKDYKFHCIHGKPVILFISQFINIPEKHTEQYFDMDYNYLAILDEHPEETKVVEKTKNFEKMKEIAETLSEGIKSVRIDLVEANGKIYFGEYTFFSGGGVTLFEPYEWEEKLGEMLQL